MKQILALVFCLAGIPLLADTVPAEVAPFGELILANLSTAPFPHPDRAKGYTYHEKVFPADKHYSDNTVGFFVPRGFRPTRKTDFIVHFHGWGGDVTNVFHHYKVAEQMVASGRNAILIVPQGPWHASDSFGGKLEDVDGFKRFMHEAVETLRAKGIIKSDKIGKIILSGHSGGYHVMSSIVEQGGLNDRIKEVWLFDALYGQTPKFVKWQREERGKILNIYTTNGGTRAESEKLAEDLKKQHVAVVAKLEKDITAKELRKNKWVFIYTDLKHNEVMQNHETFRDFLAASCFDEIK